MAFRRPPANTPPVDEVVPTFVTDLHSVALQANQSQQSQKSTKSTNDRPRPPSNAIEMRDLIGIVPTLSGDPLEQHVALLASQVPGASGPAFSLPSLTPPEEINLDESVICFLYPDMNSKLT